VTTKFSSFSLKKHNVNAQYVYQESYNYSVVCMDPWILTQAKKWT